MKLIPTTALAVLLPCAVAAQDQPQCGPRDRVVETLQGKYGEHRQALGMSKHGALMELWGNTETGSYTITITLPDGRTCLVDDGQMFELTGGDLIPTGEAL